MHGVEKREFANDNYYVIPEIQGPALTLDDLHRVFVEFNRFYPIPKVGNIDGVFGDIWSLDNFIIFKRTKNHAQDWTAILIWLLKEGHVTSEQVSETLK